MLSIVSPLTYAQLEAVAEVPRTRFERVIHNSAGVKPGGISEARPGKRAPLRQMPSHRRKASHSVSTYTARARVSTDGYRLDTGIEISLNTFACLLSKALLVMCKATRGYSSHPAHFPATFRYARVSHPVCNGLSVMQRPDQNGTLRCLRRHHQRLNSTSMHRLVTVGMAI
jgi:hypothetical protein